MRLPIPTVARRHPLVTGLMLLVATPVVVLACWTFITLSFSYSSGERAGFLQKVSKKGWICKTWEGEMQLTAIPGAAPVTFIFTTRSDSIAEILNKLSGQHVVLDYKQHVGVPSSCFGDTEYFVTGARPVGGT